MDLRLCLIATELFAWGLHGGFGAATRLIGGELAKKGVSVSAVVPAGKGQGASEELDGMKVVSYPLFRYPWTGKTYEETNADIYHSEEPSWGTKIALRTMPSSKHMATCQNPKTIEDWRLVEKHYPFRRRIFNYFFGNSVKEAVKGMDAVYCQARYIIKKARALYRLQYDPGFLPNPVFVPPIQPKKASHPTVCYLGRFDTEKRPETFFQLAIKFPEVRFVAAGKTHKTKLDSHLRKKYRHVKNLELPGFLIGSEKEKLLRESWILVNTSVNECLPVSFLEAAAHGCAILSSHDPDGFACKFGYHVPDGDLRNGLTLLLSDNHWKKKGERGRAYVSKIHELNRVIDLHLEIYEKLLATPRPSS